MNLLQLSRALGHHSPAFTLSVYAHLLEGDQAAPLNLDDALDTGRRAAGSFLTSELAA